VYSNRGAVRNVTVAGRLAFNRPSVLAAAKHGGHGDRAEHISRFHAISSE
jgi:hypothetical protein